MSGVKFSSREVYGVTISRRDPRLVQQLGLATAALIGMNVLASVARLPRVVTGVVILGFLATYVVFAVRRSKEHSWLCLDAMGGRNLISPPVLPSRAEKLAGAIRAMVDARSSGTNC